MHAFFLLATHLVLINALDLHVHKLIAVGLLQHTHDLRNRQDLVLYEEGQCLVYRLLALHFYSGQGLYRSDSLSLFLHVQEDLTLVFN